MIDECPFLFHGTSKERIESRQSKLDGNFYSGNAGDPTTPGKDIRGEVTSTTPCFSTALSYVDRVREKHGRGWRLSLSENRCTPTILAITNPENYFRVPRVQFIEKEVIVFGVISPDDFTCLDEDLDFIIKNFGSFGQYAISGFFMPEYIAKHYYEELLRINPGLRDYKLRIPEEVKQADRELDKFTKANQKKLLEIPKDSKEFLEYIHEKVLESAELEKRLREGAPKITLVKR